ncbi:O-antigen ligase family protein [Streptomyces sp. NBC_01262]|uniref:O-antigen ligase family protein n=1 Tax=Streptomyces sp. NBC_01262 TaxID=2903803 RepID=UPI002E363C1E|nr:O-antigen ligase family protein [Streptomyces sp. NBC_01262]
MFLLRTLDGFTVQSLPVSSDTLLLLLVGLTLAGNLLWVMARHYTIGVGLLLGVQVWTVAAKGQLPAMSLGVSVYPADALAVCAFCIGTVRLLRDGLSVRVKLLPLLTLIALAGWSAVRGITAYGLQAVGNDGRGAFWCVLAAALYVATMPPSAALDRVVTRTWLAMAATYAVLCLVGWASVGLHPVTAHVTVDGVGVDPRPVPAAAALVLLQGAALLLCPLGSERTAAAWRRRGKLLGAAVILAFVVLLQQRTVWIAGGAMAVTWWALRPVRAGQRITSAVAGATALSMAALAFVLGAFGTIGGALSDSAAATQGNRSTFAWRVLGWQDLLDEPRSLVHWLTGVPFGSGYDRYIRGGLVAVSPHNYYLHVVLRLGLIGLVVLAALYVLIWRRLHRGGSADLALRLMIVGQLVFFVSFSASMEQGVLLGLCLWHARGGVLSSPTVTEPTDRTSSTRSRSDVPPYAAVLPHDAIRQ